MRRTHIFAAAALALTQTATGVMAADLGLERPAAFDTSTYTFVGPAGFGSASSAASFIRFFNRSGGAAVFTLRVVGNNSGTDYMNGQTYTISVPNHASPQKRISDLKTDIQAATGRDITPTGSDTEVIVYLKTDKDGQDVGFQHVSYNGSTGYFENNSICTYDASRDYSALNRNLVNVHTSVLADVGYPARIGVVNPDSSARTVRGRVYDNDTGASLGSFTLNPAANGLAEAQLGTVETSLTNIQTLVPFTPTSSQLHVNIEFETADSTAISAKAIYRVRQVSNGAVFNMATVCATRHCTTTTTTSTTGGTTNPSGGGTTGGTTTTTTTNSCDTTTTGGGTTTNPSGS